MSANATVVRSVDVASGEAVIEAKVVGDGAAIVMIAGLDRGVSDLVDQMHAFAGAGYQAVAINMRGAEGGSGPFANLTTDMMAGDIKAVAQALGLGRWSLHTGRAAAGGGSSHS
jgi:pimeloyl-ACP methyl ester carboxylesterase